MTALRKTASISAILSLCLGALAGCKKAEPPSPPPLVYQGISVELPRLQSAITNADQAAQNGVRLAGRAFHYRQFPQALAQLEQLSANPSLSEAQKSLLGQVIEQTKQVLEKAKPPAAQ